MTTQSDAAGAERKRKAEEAAHPIVGAAARPRIETASQVSFEMGVGLISLARSSCLHKSRVLQRWQPHAVTSGCDWAVSQGNGAGADNLKAQLASLLSSGSVAARPATAAARPQASTSAPSTLSSLGAGRLASPFSTKVRRESGGTCSCAMVGSGA